MQLFYLNIKFNIGDVVDFGNQEAQHISKVLRKEVGDFIFVCNGKGVLYDAELVSSSKKKCSVKIISLLRKDTTHNQLTIAIAPTKNIARTEWFIEKSIEVGVNKIDFISCSNSERKIINLERLKLKGLSAMKQSLNLFLPEMSELIKFSKYIELVSIDYDVKLIAYCNEHSTQLSDNFIKNKTALVLIGPEGGFTNKEISIAVNYGFKPVSLGKNRLRTETAGVFTSCVYNALTNN